VSPNEAAIHARRGATLASADIARTKRRRLACCCHVADEHPGEERDIKPGPHATDRNPRRNGCAGRSPMGSVRGPSRIGALVDLVDGAGAGSRSLTTAASLRDGPDGSRRERGSTLPRSCVSATGGGHTRVRVGCARCHSGCMSIRAGAALSCGPSRTTSSVQCTHRYVLRAVEVGADDRLEWSAAREVLPDECEKMVVRERCGGSHVRSEPIRGEGHARDFGTRGGVARSSPYRGCKSEISVVGWKSWKVDSY